jgi:hypothetical protein
MSATTQKQARKPRPVRARAGRARSGVGAAGGAGGPQDLILAEVVQGLQPEVLRRLRSMSRGELASLSQKARLTLARHVRDISAQLALASLCLEGLIEVVPRERQVSGGAGRQDSQAPLRVTEPDQLYETARRNRELLVASGELVTSQRLAETLGVTRQAVQQGREARRLFSLEARGEDYFPSFYADPGLDRKVLEDITRVLGDLPAAEKWVFFTTRRGSLGDLTPLDALRKGRRAQVERAAAAFTER